MSDPVIDVSIFDAVSPAAAVELLRTSCASSAWLDAVVAGRPYGSLGPLIARSDAVLESLAWPDIEEAMAAHPRIGERGAGTGRESSWSRQEQAAAAGEGAALREGNAEYERQFGQVFLICATGRSSGEILAALRRRLGNDEGTEREVVRGELAAIVRLRLAKTLR